MINQLVKDLVRAEEITDDMGTIVKSDPFLASILIKHYKPIDAKKHALKMEHMFTKIQEPVYEFAKTFGKDNLFAWPCYYNRSDDSYEAVFVPTSFSTIFAALFRNIERDVKENRPFNGNVHWSKVIGKFTDEIKGNDNFQIIFKVEFEFAQKISIQPEVSQTSRTDFAS